MLPLLALTIIFGVYALGDLAATKSKALLSMMLICSIIFLVAFWCGLPADIFATSGLTAFSSVTICMFLVHIGSTIKVRDFFDEWKTVVLVAGSTILSALSVYLIGRFLMDRYYALVGGPCLAGGMVAYLIMQSVGETLGREDVTVFALMILSFHAFVGVPLASVPCKAEAVRLIQDWRAGNYKPQQSAGKKDGKAQHALIFKPIPEKYNSSNVILFKVALIALAAQLLSQATGINQLIFGLVLGVVFHELGFLDDGALQKANGFGFVIAGALSNVFAGLANTTPQMLISMLKDIVVVHVIGIAVAIVIAVAVGRLVRFNWRLSIAVSMTALFGFPGTYLISKEVSDAVGENPEEVKVIMDYLMPKMIIGGIVSVSIVSGIVASIMCSWI